MHLESIFALFSNVNGIVRNYERDRTIDIMDELTGKEHGHECIMSPSDRCFIDCVYLKTVRQKSSDFGVDTSTRASADIPTRRLFRIFELRMPQSVYLRSFVLSPFVRILTDDELKTTDGGCKAGRTKDGTIIQNNLFFA